LVTSKVQFHVAQNGDEWTVKTETRAVGRYTDRVRAIAAAIDLANAAAKAGRMRRSNRDRRSYSANHMELRERFVPVQCKPKNTRTRGTYRATPLSIRLLASPCP
jgi:hypothetical protein